MQLMMHYSCPWKAGGKLNFIKINALAHVLTFSIVHGNDQKSKKVIYQIMEKNILSIQAHNEVNCT